MSKRRSVVVCVMSLLAGCMTYYDGKGLGGGLEVSQEADGTWLVLSSGNGYTPVEAVRDYSYLKAAETVKAQGSTCFVVVGEHSEYRKLDTGYGFTDFPVARLRFRILDSGHACTENNADQLIAELGPKVRSQKAYEGLKD